MHIRDYLRLGVRGLLLEPGVYRQQRDAPDTLRQGLMLVLLVGVLVGVATTLGHVGEWLVSPPQAMVQRTVYEGLTEMPWYQNVSFIVPDFEETFKQQFDIVFGIMTLLDDRGGSLTMALVNGVATPLLYLVTWLVYGLVAHVGARGLGGKGTLQQTLGCTALAAGANLLALVQVVPFAQAGGVLIVALLANYLALREAHTLTPWRAFWAAMLGPLLLVVLVVLVVLVALVVVLGRA
jgi:hypothetical protein